MQTTTIKKTIEIKANLTIDVLENGKAYYNYQGNHFRVFKNEEDALEFIKTNNDNLVVAEFDDEKALDYYLETGISSIDDIEDLEHKALILKETFEQMKQMSESAEDEISDELLIEETIAFLVQDEVYQGDERELRFICASMDISMIERCSCCGVVLMPDDECYGDELNNEAPLCDHCSIFNDQTDMYQKSVQQDVIEKLTGLKFSPHLGNVGSKIEEFNYWLNENSYEFGFKESDNKDIFTEFLNECTEWNICDCCGLIEKSTELNWDDEDLFDEDYQNFRFLQGTNIAFDAVCDDCLNKVNKRTYLSLEDITSRLIENKMHYRVGDYVILENVNFSKRNIVQNTIFGTIESLNTENETYSLIEFPGIDFKDEDFFDNSNEAYVNKYTDFIADNYPEKSGEVDEWSYPNYEGHADIKMAFENYGYKKEFIEYLKSNDLPYGRFIDANDEIIEELDEVDIVKNDILNKIFCIDADNDIVVPSFNELVAADKYQPNWQLAEDYQNYSLPSIIQIVNELTENFFTTLEVLNSHKEKFRKSKKYAFRETIEYGAPYEVVKELQRLHEFYDDKDLNDEPEMICLQANVTTQDYSTIEVVLDFYINENELSHYLKSTLNSEHHDEVDKLLEAIKQAKADKHETLHVYDC